MKKPIASPLHGPTPAAAARPGGRAKSRFRLAVEAALRTATIAQPLTPEQVCARCAVHVTIVRGLIATICHAGAAHNTNPGKKPARYAWGQPERKEVTPDNRHRTEGNHYDGAELRPFSARPGAMNAFAKPSLVNGEAVERKAPALITAQPEPRR